MELAPQLTPAEAEAALRDEGALAVDVREADEWAAGHMAGLGVDPARRAGRRASASSRATGRS